jgi:hypothetical protein
MAKEVERFYVFYYIWLCTIILHWCLEPYIYYSDTLAKGKKFYKHLNRLDFSLLDILKNCCEKINII